MGMPIESCVHKKHGSTGGSQFSPQEYCILFKKQFAYHLRHDSYVSQVFNNEFRRSSNKTNCKTASKNTIKTFYFPSAVIPDETFAQRLCENFCARKEPCWGCIRKCDTGCQWVAVSSCGENANFEDSVDSADISQKPSIKCMQLVHI